MFEIELFICIKMNLALNNQQRLICQKNQPTNQPTNQSKVKSRAIVKYETETITAKDRIKDEYSKFNPEYSLNGSI